MPSPQTLAPPPSIGTLLGEGPLALFLDFDGTLVEIAPAPDAIEVPARLPALLDTLAARLEGRLALVSGRALDDIECHLGPLAIARAGSHGAHCVAADGKELSDGPLPIPEGAIARLRQFAATKGLRYEAKSHGGALHFRSHPEMEDEVEAAARAIASEFDLSIKRGKAVAELVRPGTSKASAVRSFMDHAPFGGATPVFVGDDVTDEDGFAGAIEFAGFGVAVGERTSEKAQYRLDSVTAVLEWLET